MYVSGTDTSDLGAFVLHLNDSYWEDVDDGIELSNVTVYITDASNSYGRDFSGFYFPFPPLIQFILSVYVFLQMKWMSLVHGGGELWSLLGFPLLKI